MHVFASSLLIGSVFIPPWVNMVSKQWLKRYFSEQIKYPVFSNLCTLRIAIHHHTPFYLGASNSTVGLIEHRMCF